MKQPARDDKLNLLSGAIFLALLAAVGLYFGIRELVSTAKEEQHAYVAYFENSGGLREGDRVRIQGRAAGEVKDVQVVNHEGRIVTRVEFVITPGTGSDWLTKMEKAGGIPRDSTIEIRMPRMLGRPVLVISIGKDDANPIPEGGEWKNTKSANEQDQLSQWGEDITRARGQIRSFNEFFDDKEKFDKLRDNLDKLADGLESADSALAKLEGRTGDIGESLDTARERMDQTREDVNSRGESTAAALGDVVANTGKTVEQLDEFAGKLSDAMRELDRIAGTVGDTVSGAEKSKLDELGLELRRLATRLRAGMEVAERDPKQFDMPNWRRSRAYFHGGEPSGGTSIDEPPPEAPGERAGIPKGETVPKRAK